jgi:hypothetical protein
VSTYVSRDPFARETLMRDRVYQASGCRWCGQSHHTKDHKRSYNFVYFIETDGGRKRLIEGEFCSVSCMRAYRH